MKRAMIFEWRRMCRSKTFLISLLGVCAFMLKSAVSWYLLYRQGINADTSVFCKWQGLGSYLPGDHLVFVLLPLFLGCAYSWTACEDRVSGYINQIVSRVGKRHCFAAKFAVSFCSGGLIFAGALCFHFACIALFSPAYMPMPGDQMSAMNQFHFCAALFFTHPTVFSLVWTLTAFCWGGAIAVTAVLAGMLIRNPFVSALTPFLLFTGEQLIGSILMRDHPYYIHGVQISVIWTEMLYAGAMSTTLTAHVLFWICSITAVSAVGCCICGRCYESR